MSEDKRKEFERLSRELIEFLNNNYHPHTTIIVTSTSAELVEGLMAIHTYDYIENDPKELFPRTNRALDDLCNIRRRGKD